MGVRMGMGMGMRMEFKGKGLGRSVAAKMGLGFKTNKGIAFYGLEFRV